VHQLRREQPRRTAILRSTSSPLQAASADPALIQAARSKLETWEATPFLERLDELMALETPAPQAAEVRSVGRAVSS
jgi:hypothetical protein